MKTYNVIVNASPRYPIRKSYLIEAGSWSTAIARGVKKYFKDHRNFRTSACYVSAVRVSGSTPRVAQAEPEA